MRGPYSAPAARAMRKSDIKSDFPISKLVRLAKMSAMISVPPEDAPILNKMAEPAAGRMTAKQNSKNKSLVKGSVSGQIHSKAVINTDKAKDE